MLIDDLRRRNCRRIPASSSRLPSRSRWGLVSAPPSSAWLMALAFSSAATYPAPGWPGRLMLHQEAFHASQISLSIKVILARMVRLGQ